MQGYVMIGIPFKHKQIIKQFCSKLRNQYKSVVIIAPI